MKINKHTEFRNMNTEGERPYKLPLYKVQLVREDTLTSEVSSIIRPEQAASIVMDDLRNEDREKFMVMMLNTKNKVIGLNLVSIGTLSATIVHPREVFKPAVIAGAASIILIHNHPSGDPSPSQEDLEITRKLVDAGKIMGIDVRDHVIIGDGVFYSLRQQGLL